ncbi:MAG: M67 family metallopeptidase [Rhodospirillaceae bacterium]|nr:M67 family metallopeptidase [Rhodospirillaceae bacterium]MBT5308770.1 M67 family metallopeptidase [Rhodospirillaceae bacterium]
MISIPADLMQQINDAAEAAYPEECCGLLAGRTAANGDITVTRLGISNNVASGDRSRRFEVDPKVRFDLMRALDDGDIDEAEEIIGHYHSHPNHPARPSEHDLEMAFEPDLIWLIIGVENGRATDATAWGLNDAASGFDAVAISSN